MRRLTEKEIQEMRNLVVKGKSLNKIMQITGLGKSTIYYHVCDILPKSSKADLSRLSDWERGYLIGLFFGDGNFWVNSKNYSYRVVMNFNAKTETEIVRNVLEILRKTGSRPYTQRFGNRLRVTCISKDVYIFLCNHSSYVRVEKGNTIINRKDDIKGFELWNMETGYGFVAGMIDSDGFLGADKIKYVRVIITSYSKNFVDSFTRILKSLGIEFHVQTNRWNRYDIRISTPSYQMHRQKIKCVKGR
jgi:hypothetical protein